MLYDFTFVIIKDNSIIDTYTLSAPDCDTAMFYTINHFNSLGIDYDNIILKENKIKYDDYYYDNDFDYCFY